MTNKVITITRQYGSGGREIGQKLAEDLGVEFYDNKLLEVAAGDSGIHKSHFEENDDDCFVICFADGFCNDCDNQCNKMKFFHENVRNSLPD